MTKRKNSPNSFMRVSRIRLKNWRNFSAAEVPLGNRMFIAGPNASGKSNFLDAFKFLRDIAIRGGGLQHAISVRGGLSKIRCLAARADPAVEIDIHLSRSASSESDWRYEICLKQHPRGTREIYVEFERIWKNGISILNRPNKEDLDDPLLRTQTHLEQITTNQKFREIYDYLSSVSYLHLIPQLLRNPEAFSGSENYGQQFGRNFLERVAKTPKHIRESRLRRIGKALRIAVPQLSQLSLTKDSKGVPHLEAVYSHWRALGAKQQEDQFSDGTLRLLALLWSLMEGDSLLLLEEPELSLSSAIIRMIPSLMHSVQREKKRQIILSTHSFDLLLDPGISGEEVIMLTPQNEGTLVELASSKREIQLLLRSGVPIAEIVFPYLYPEGIEQMELFK